MRKIYRWLRGDGPLWRIGVAIGGTLALALAIAIAVTVTGLHFLHFLHFKAFKPEPLLSAGTLYDLLKVAFAVAAGIGGVIALVTAYRRQRITEFAQALAQQQHELADRIEERTARDSELQRELQRELAYRGEERQDIRLFNERFITVAAQLGDDKPAAARLAGVYAMAGLADDWPAQRQTCVDVLCAYLRMPYEPDPGDEAPSEARQAFRALREVRHTVIRVITAHLQADDRRASTAQDWRGVDLDLTGVVFDGGSFDRAEFSGRVRFTGADFSGRVTFDGARFSDVMITFTGARFSSGRVSFDGAEFSGVMITFTGARFSGGAVTFTGARFSGGWVDFGRARFSGGTVGFYGARFSGGAVYFTGGEFSGGSVSFEDAEFSDGSVSFEDARFSGGWVDFGRARFSGGTVDFGRARFSGGTVDFRAPLDWSVPPKMPSGQTPPPGVLLPTDQPQRGSR